MRARVKLELVLALRRIGDALRDVETPPRRRVALSRVIGTVLRAHRSGEPKDAQKALDAVRVAFNEAA